MSGVILLENSNPDSHILQEWIRSLPPQLPSFRFVLWTINTPNEQVHRLRHEIEFAVVWRIPVSVLAGLPNLRAILMMSAGVDRIRPINAIPKHIPIVRLIDPTVLGNLATYVISWVTRYHLQMDVYAKQQPNKVWYEHPAFTPRAEFNVGFLGFGNVGQAICKAFSNLGYKTSAWCRSERQNTQDVRIYNGEHQLGQFLGDVDALVNTLPLTDQTRKIINAERFAKLKGGVVLINVGRGATLDTDAVCAALDAGLLKAAVLDVFETEPLPAHSPLWSYPGVVVTPHVSGTTYASSGCKLVAENIKKICAGKSPFPVVNRETGY